MSKVKIMVQKRRWSLGIEQFFEKAQQYHNFEDEPHSFQVINH